MMNKHFNPILEKEVTIIHPGEFYVCRIGEEVISTVLGSCISVCLRDIKNGVVGMNHFMMPGTLANDDQRFDSSAAKYGVYAMEMLIGDMVKMGADRRNFEAKVFGGGRVLKFRAADGDIPSHNINFITKYFQKENIPLLSSNVGGDVGRKLFLFTDSFKVLLKRFEVNKNSEEFIEENEYKKKVFIEKEKFETQGGELVLF